MNRSQVGVDEKLIMLGYVDPQTEIKQGLLKMSISKLAYRFGVAVSTLSRYCDKHGIRESHKHPKNEAIQVAELSEAEKQAIRNLPLVQPMFFCLGCEEDRPEELRGKIITEYCTRCERHHRQRRA